MAENQPVTSSEEAKKTTQQNARIFAMPERYRHGKEGTLHIPEKPKPKPVPVPPVIVKPQVKPVAQAMGKKHGMSGGMKSLIIIGIVIVVLLLVGGYLLLRSQQSNSADIPKDEPVVVEEKVVEEVVVEEDVIEPAPTGSESPFPKSTTPGIDSDSDGLTDLEESLVYGTNPKLPDTDSDGFLDGNEVFHRYNPSGTQPGTLLEAKLALELSAGNYNLLYPAKWLVVPGEGYDFTVSVTTGEKVTLKSMPKEVSLSLSDWYAAQGKEANVVSSVTKNSYPQLVANNQLTSYINLGNSVLVLDYDTGIKGTVDYLQSFQLMINSVQKNVVDEQTTLE